MISDEERREVAAKLSGEAQAWRGTFPDEACDLGDMPAAMQDLGHFAGFRGKVLYSDFFQRFSDLIDRPKAKREHAGNYWLCKHCGAFNRKDAVTDCCGVIPSRCCGNCGREWEK